MSRLVETIFSLFKKGHLLHVAYDSGGKDKTTVVLLHGIAATHRSWDLVIKKLDLKKYRVIAVDLLGFGQSPKPLDISYSVKDHTRSLRLTIKKCQITRPFILTGHSMGSIIAVDYARTYPLDVSQLFLLSLPIYQKSDRLRQTKLTKKKIDLFLKAYDYLSSKKSVAIKYSKNVRKILKVSDGVDVVEENWYPFRKSLINTVVRQKVIDNIQNIYVPISIIYGSLDALLIKENIKLLRDVNKVNVAKIKGVHHLINSKFAFVAAEAINRALD